MSKLVKLFKQTFSLPKLLGITAAAEEQRNELAKRILAVKSVTTAAQQAAAVSLGREAQTYIKAVKDAGLEFRRPINEFVALVKKAEDDHLEPLLPEKERLAKLCGEFAEQEQRRIAREEEERQRQLQKAEEERLAAEEAANAAAIKAAQSGKAKDVAAATKLTDAARKAESAVQGIIAAPLPETTRPAGVSNRQVLRWEVTDINALVRARPDLCKIEPKASAINACCVPGMPNQPPGLRLWYEKDLSFRKN